MSGCQPFDDLDSLYDPFRRFDQYGTKGMVPQPWWEILRLAILAVTVFPMKASGTLISIIMAYLSARLNFLVPKPYRRRVLTATMKFWARSTLFCVGFLSVQRQVIDEGGSFVASNIPQSITRRCITNPSFTHGQADPQRLKGPNSKKPVAVGAVVSNHVGWVDILVQMYHYFPSFVAREETATLPFIGVCCKAMDGLFVNRERQGIGNPEFVGVAAKVKRRMANVCSAEGEHLQPMLLFPEGTTTNGRYLLDFKKGAFLAGVPVLPVIIKYGQNRVSPAWESIGGAWHVFLMMCHPIHQVTVIELPVYVPNKEEMQDPAKYAKNVRKVMLDYSRLAASNATFEDKRVYHANLMGQKQTIVKKTN